MKKKIIGLLVLTLFVGTLAIPALAHGQTTPTQAAEADVDSDEQSPSYSSSNSVEDAQYEGMSDVEEAAALAGLTSVTPEQAKAVALDAYPGTTVIEVELDNENGAVVYGIELSNGMDVKVDAGNLEILHVDMDND